MLLGDSIHLILPFGGKFMSTYEAREKRILDAIALREPDRVPISMHIQTFHVQFAGLTVADIVYDMDKNVDAMIKYLQHFLPEQFCTGFFQLEFLQAPRF